MPLGAMPGMTYEENETYLAPSDSILLYSDGLIEAHSPDGEMFGFPRLQQVVANSSGGEHPIDACLTELRAFVGPDWEQEDDITLVTLKRTMSRSSTVMVSGGASEQSHPRRAAVVSSAASIGFGNLTNEWARICSALYRRALQRWDVS